MMTYWISILIVGFVTTVIFRGGFILFQPFEKFPQWFEEFLDYVPIAAMFALSAAFIIFEKDAGGMSWSIPQIAAGVATAIIAYISKRMVVTLIGGMVALYIAQYVLT